MMKNITKYQTILICFLVFSACASTNNDDITKAEWLMGTWETKTERGSIYETWSKSANDEFSGRSYTVKGKDTIVFEHIQLIQGQDSLFYIPTVKAQNDGLPVRFASKSISEQKLVFENPNHDFPQVITYKKVNADSLIAVISGIRNGQEDEQIFPMKRVKYLSVSQ
jgi:hypothetical protein